MWLRRSGLFSVVRVHRGAGQSGHFIAALQKIGRLNGIGSAVAGIAALGALALWYLGD
jgi:hypothetical protein